MKIRLEIDGYADDFDEDSYYPGCQFFKFVSDSGIVWESSYYDNDDIEAEKELKKELFEAIADLKVNIISIDTSGCVMDWELVGEINDI